MKTFDKCHCNCHSGIFGYEHKDCGECQDRLLEEAEALGRMEGVAQAKDIVAAANMVLEEIEKANPYDRRGVRFPSKGEAALRKALEKKT